MRVRVAGARGTVFVTFAGNDNVAAGITCNVRGREGDERVDNGVTG